MTIYLDGNSLSIEDFVKVSVFKEKVELTEEARNKITKSRMKVENIIGSGRAIYGINTGFGDLVKVKINEEQEKLLQINLIRSHSTGYGNPLQEEYVRGMILSRINALAKGYSGVTLELVEFLIKLLNENIIPLIPEKGSVGASGDLSPLAHLVLSIMGEWYVLDNGKIKDSREALREHGMEPILLKEKEGLSLINGTSYMLSILTISYWMAEIAFKNSYISNAWSFATLKGTDRALCMEFAKARNFPELEVTSNIIGNILKGNKAVEEARINKVQDAYSLRCSPTVMASVLRTMNFVKDTITLELNSATDNPLIFDEPISGCNFHGENLAFAADFLSIALTDLGNIIERRIFRILDHNLSGLKPFLADNPGLESGLMISQYLAAALCNENKVLAVPSSIDTIPTSANQEDHVSMGSTGVRKLKQIVDNLIGIISIEFLVNYKASLMYGLTGEVLTRVFSKIRENVGEIKGDMVLTPKIEKIAEIIKNGELLKIANL